MTFTPRTTAPSTTDKRWINTGYGGYNGCIVIDSTTGLVLPNCTGYVHGRWMEIGNTTTDYALSINDAVTYWEQANGVFERGQSPKLGAIAVFSTGTTTSGHPGHVGVVEEINDNGVLLSNSNYGGDYFYMAYVSDFINVTFLGYIYHPDISDTPTPTPTPASAGKMKLMYYMFNSVYRNKNKY